MALWERVEAELAARSGIDVAASELVKIAGRNVLVLRRFDREGDRRLGFASAMTMLEAEDGDARSYAEIASVIELHSKTVNRDLKELFRRTIFSILTNNTDDHLRNHGFLRVDNAWQLSPAYDMNPNPDAGEERTTAVDPDGLNASVESMCSVAATFRLSQSETKEIVGEVEVATREWRRVAQALGAGRDEINRMETAYETEQRTEALHFASTN
jgi:serine/threonine-protein kinase HipA